MKRNTTDTLLTAAGLILGIAGLALIALSAFAGKNTLTWGLACVALGTVTSIILSARKKKEQ